MVLPSPGIVGLAPAYPSGVESSTLVLRVSRNAGKDGAISVEYATSDNGAPARANYIPVSGRLDWADGDTSDKLISIPLLQYMPSSYNDFQVRINGATGGTWIFRYVAVATVKSASTAGSPPVPRPSSDSSAPSGGSGFFDMLTVGLLLILIAAAARFQTKEDAQGMDRLCINLHGAWYQHWGRAKSLFEGTFCRSNGWGNAVVGTLVATRSFRKKVNSRSGGMARPCCDCSPALLFG